MQLGWSTFLLGWSTRVALWLWVGWWLPLGSKLFTWWIHFFTWVVYFRVGGWVGKINVDPGATFKELFFIFSSLIQYGGKVWVHTPCCTLILWEMMVLTQNSAGPSLHGRARVQIFFFGCNKFCLVKCCNFQLFWSPVGHNIDVLRHFCTLCVAKNVNLLWNLQYPVGFITGKYYKILFRARQNSVLCVIHQK